MKNNATAVWTGTGSNGAGQLNTPSNVLNSTGYSYITRTQSGKGTNPEELIAAAHAGCFAMKLAFVFEAQGYRPERLEVNCEIDFVAEVISGSRLMLKAKIAGITPEEFNELVNDAGQNCPVSVMMKNPVTIHATLEN